MVLRNFINRESTNAGLRTNAFSSNRCRMHKTWAKAEAAVAIEHFPFCLRVRAHLCKYVRVLFSNKQTSGGSEYTGILNRTCCACYTINTQ